MILGFTLFLLSFPLLWMNERRFVKTQRRLEHSYQECTETNCREINPNLQGKLVCVTGDTQCLEMVSDPEFLVSKN